MAFNMTTNALRDAGGIILSVWMLLAGVAGADAAPTYAERLGWKANDVVVILHVDDVGMSHESNMGAIQSVEKGSASSFAIMMPCPWVPEIARWLKKNPRADAGLHLTLTSEWGLYRWGPLAGKSRVPGLVDTEGCIWHSVEETAAHASADEIETEIRAQLDRAVTLGVPITHLDSHMGTLFARPDYFARFARVGIEKHIPILAVGGHMTHAQKDHPAETDALRLEAEKIWQAGLPVIDDLHTSGLRWKNEERKAKLFELLSELKPGITEILFHASVESDNFHLVTGTHAGRWNETQVLTDPDLKKLLGEKGIILTTWRELQERRDAVKGK